MTVDTFRLKLSSKFSLVFLSVFLIAAFVLRSVPPASALIAVGGVAFWLISALVSVVEIGPDGIRLYWINWLPCSDMTRAKATSVLGLPYLLISRANGMPWWLPLYFNGSRPIVMALQEHAPSGSPLLSAIEHIGHT